MQFGLQGLATYVGKSLFDGGFDIAAVLVEFIGHATGEFVVDSRLGTLVAPPKSKSTPAAVRRRLVAVFLRFLLGFDDMYGRRTDVREGM